MTRMHEVPVVQQAVEIDQAANFTACNDFFEDHAEGYSVIRSILPLRRPRTIRDWCWRSVVCLLAIVVCPVACAALEIRPEQTRSGIVLRLRGDIKEGDYSRLKAHFKGKTIVGLDLSSDGGDLEEGLRIAALVRRKVLTIYVAGQCNSVCSDLFFAAANRYFAADSRIGVHAVSNDRDIEDAGSKLLTVKLARLWAKEGVPHSIIGKMVTTRPEAITYLNPTDLSDLHASTGDPFADTTEKSSGTGQPQQH